MMRNKKGQMGGNLMAGVSFVIMLVVLVVATSLGGDTLDTIKGTQTADSAAENITEQGLDGLLNFSDQTPTIGTVGAIVIVLSLIIGLLVIIPR